MTNREKNGKRKETAVRTKKLVNAMTVMIPDEVEVENRH